MEFDVLGDALRIRHSGGGEGVVVLEPKPVSRFYRELTAVLADLGIPAPIRPAPNEVDPAVPFAEDHGHRSYDHDAVHLFWQQLIQAERVLQRFRSSFIGKASPVHFFWGAMDLASTRFSGRPAPAHPEACRTAPTGSWWRATPTNCAAAASGRAAPPRVPSTPTRIPSRRLPGRARHTRRGLLQPGGPPVPAPLRRREVVSGPRRDGPGVPPGYLRGGRGRRGWDRAALEADPGRLAQPAPPGP
jgi:hypothetical protein